MPRKGAKHTTMSDDIRICLCRHHTQNPELTQTDLVRWVYDSYGLKVTQATVSNTLKRKSELLGRTSETNLSAKRQRSVRYPLMESALVDWFKANQERVNLSGDLIREHAERILDRLYPDHDPFMFSNGWLDAFKSRHGIRCHRRFGESGSVDEASITDALPRLREILDKYEWKDIYNMDETGLFYRMQMSFLMRLPLSTSRPKKNPPYPDIAFTFLPFFPKKHADHSLASRQLEGRKQNKERITVVICCNGDGSHKLPLWIIGRHAKPRCFKSINRENLGCKYRNNSKAWMTQAIFWDWLKDFNRRMANRQVLLILDNCSAHIPLNQLPDNITLNNTEVLFLPPNMTSKIQPCDQGIIRNFKAYYRKRFNQHLLQGMDDNVENPEKINVLQAIRMAVASWSDDVTATTIANCFRHCKIRSEPANTPEIQECQLIDQGVVEELQSQIRRFHYPCPMDIRNLLNYPAEQRVSYVPDIDDVIQNYEGHKDDEEEDDSFELPQISPAEAQKMLQSLDVFWLQQEEDTQKFMIWLQQMKDRVCALQIKQTVQKDIRDYFK